MNRPKNRIYITAYLTRWNPEYHQPTIAHPRIAGTIALRSLPIVMHPPVDLNNQLCRRTVEIDGVRPDRVLSAELQPGKSSSAQL